MEAILRQYIFLNDEQYGQLVKMALKHSAGIEITQEDGTEEMRLFYDSCVRKEVEQIIKERERARKRRIKNEN